MSLPPITTLRFPSSVLPAAAFFLHFLPILFLVFSITALSFLESTINELLINFLEITKLIYREIFTLHENV